ncbi:MAG: hypothetical protein IJ511_00295 [Bacteroides sp.]|nr:hypothetical protein [Bacteroides sp.]
MKRTIIALAITLTCCGWLSGQDRTVNVYDAASNTTRVIEVHDTVVNGQKVTDTLSITTYSGQDVPTYPQDYDNAEPIETDLKLLESAINAGTLAMLIPIVAIIFTFGLPAIIIFTIFYFRHKNRKAKYRLAEQALAAGQPLPNGLFKEIEQPNLRERGIKNIFLGIGLSIFLYAIGGEFSLACIGILVLCTGLGQIVCHYTREKNDKR